MLTDGGAVVTTSTEGPLVWADAATGRELRRAQPSPRMGPLGGPMHVAQLLPSRDPRTGRAAVFGLVPAKGGGRCLVAFWDAASGELLAERPLEDRRHAGAVAVSAAGRLLAREVTDLPPGVETADARDCMAVVIEDTLTGTGLLRVEQPDCLQRGSVGLTPDGHSLVTWTTAYPHGRHDGAPAGTTTVRLWEVRAGRQRLAFTLPVVGKEWADEPEASTVSAATWDAT